MSEETRDQNISITKESITVNNLQIFDEELASYLTEFSQDKWEDIARRAFKIGLLSLKGSTSVDKVDYVEKEFNRLNGKLEKQVNTFANDFEKRLQGVFGDEHGNKGIMKRTLDTYLGTGGQLEDLFDPKNKESAISKISNIFEEYFRGKDSVFYSWLDHSNPDSPIAKFKKDLTDNYLGEMKKYLIGEEAAEQERDKGTRKGMTYQDRVFESLNEICSPFGDIPENVANQVGKLPKSKVGDMVVELNRSTTSGAQINLVIEAKDAGNYNASKVTNELKEAQANRGATVGIMVFDLTQCPEVCYPLQQYGDDKIVCGYNPDDEKDICLKLAYRLARIAAITKLHDLSPQIDLVKLQTLISECKSKLKAIVSIKAKVTKLANEVNTDLGDLSGELSNLFDQLDSESNVATT